MRIKPKKSLGQNFLIDKNIRRKIVDLLELKPSDIVLEIGSGNGELTGLIAQRVDKIYALEIDSNLCTVLKTNLKGYPNIEIINRNILKFDPSTLLRVNPERAQASRRIDLKQYFRKLDKKRKLKVFGNIPYYISSPIIGHLLAFRNKIDTVFITIQREFAARIIACPGSKDYGAFSCFVQYYAEPKIILNIKKTCFFPKPKIDSCLIRLRIRKNPCVRPKDEGLFFKIIRASFNKRRKTLRNSLKGVVLPQKLDAFFAEFGINNRARPEELSLEDFANLSNMWNPL